MIWLVRLYPQRWRSRYGHELEQLIRDLRPSGFQPALALDLIKGAIGAHARQGLSMNQVHQRVAARVAIIVGVAWLCLFTEILLTNVVFPSTTDDDAIPVLLSYVGIFAALAFTGFLAARAGATRRGQLVAGLFAGVLIGILVTASFVIVDNVWLDVVARQPNKIEGFAHSDAATMREFINDGLIGVAVFLTVALGTFGAALGIVGGFAGDAGGRTDRHGHT